MALNGDESELYGADAGSYGVTDYYSAGGLTNFYGDGDAFAGGQAKRGFRGGRGAGMSGGPMRGAGGMRGGASLGGRGGGFASARGGAMGGMRGGRGAPRGAGGPMRGAGRGGGQRFNPLASAGGFGGSNGGAAPLGHIVFAYNIGPMTSEDDVRALFSLYGGVTKVDVIWDFAKNAGKGFAFVTMPNYEEAVYAISQLNGYNYAGKPLQVSFKSAKQ